MSAFAGYAMIPATFGGAWLVSCLRASAGNDPMTRKKLYKVIFYNQEDVFEIYASHVYPSEMYGFVEVEQLTFGERSQLLVDPSQEKLRNEFEGVSRTLIPMGAVIRIDEVEQVGTPRVTQAKGAVTQFPGKPGRPDR